MAYMYRITTGDWSQDGHNQTDDFYIISNKTFEDLDVAWLKAKEACPQLDPKKMCDEFEDSRVPAEVEEWLVHEHVDFYNMWTESDPMADCAKFTCPQSFVEYMFLFMKIGDPDLDLKVLNVPWLSFATGGYGLYYL